MNVLDYWNQRATLGTRAGSDDLIAKQLEQRAILAEMPIGTPAWTLEVGCGLGETAGLVADWTGTQVLAIDAAEGMVAAGKPHPRVEYRHRSVDEMSDLGFFGCVYTQRCLINLPDWGAQKRAIDAIAARLFSGGLFLMCENSQDGLDAINEARASIQLPRITRPWHNAYLKDADLATVTSLKLLRCVPFSATYYLLSRVINAKLASWSRCEPSYDAPINTLARTLPAIADPRLAQNRLWVWQKA